MRAMTGQELRCPDALREVWLGQSESAGLWAANTHQRAMQRLVPAAWSVGV